MIESIAIGSFDGMHIAHQELIKRCNCIVVIGRGTGTLTRGWKRSLYTNKQIAYYYLDKIKNLSGEEFIKKLKRDFPHLKKIVVGYDFRFGKDRCGTVEKLKKIFDGEVEVVKEVKIDNISVHTKRIREFLQASKITEANRLLGRNYIIDGRWIKGLGLGTKELVSTINLNVKNYILPNGVFAVKAMVNGKIYNAVAFLGKRVSVDNSFSVEFHILEEFKEEIKGRVWIEFIDFIRENKKFNSIADLKKQILKDIEKAKKILE